MPMKTIISSICGAVLLVVGVGCASGPYYAPIAERAPYNCRRPLLYARATPEPCEITRTQEAWCMRRAALRRTAAIEAAEAAIYTSTPARPTGTGVSTFMPPMGTMTPGPGMCAPPGSAGPMGPGIVPPGPPLGPSPVAERYGNGAPMAAPVPGKPGYVVSPYSPNSGYVDVSGMTPGSEARDPYSGKIFRVP